MSKRGELFRWYTGHLWNDIQYVKEGMEELRRCSGRSYESLPEWIRVGIVHKLENILFRTNIFYDRLNEEDGS